MTGGEPNDLYIDGNTAYIVGDGGYIYQSSDILSGVTVIDAGDATSENLNRIHGSDTTLMATGANGALVLSTNSGETWAIPTVTPFADAGTAIFVLDNFRAWIGSDGGQVFYTLNGGESWIEQNFSGSGSGQVNDIVFATDETGFISHSAATPTARLLTTMDGGETWGLSTQAGQRRITNWPTFDQANRIAVPLQADINVLVNNIAIAGLAGDGTDGVIYLGVASFK